MEDVSFVPQTIAHEDVTPGNLALAEAGKGRQRQAEAGKVLVNWFCVHLYSKLQNQLWKFVSIKSEQLKNFPSACLRCLFAA